MANVTKPMALDETLQDTNTALTSQSLKLEGIITKLQGIIAALAGNNPIIGDTDISSIADGTVTGAIDEINTTLEELSISDLSDTNISNPSDGEVIKYDATNQKWVNGSSGYAHHYSTTEQVIGTWVDGKPLYEKTWDFGSNISLASQSWTDTPIKISDYAIKLIVNAFGTNQAGTFFGFLGCNTDQAYVQVLQSRNAIITLRYLTLQYTKTTD